MEQKYIYVVFSSTPYKVGKMIRRVTGETYNHVSISLDRELTKMYSFSRRYYKLPLWGGFVRESRSRYAFDGQPTRICLCELPVTAQQYQDLSELLDNMHQRNRFYIYNHLSALGSVIHRPIRAKDAYTCVEFCVNILQQLGVPVESGKYYSVGDVHRILKPYIIYRGAMEEPDSYDGEYYRDDPVPHPTLTTLKDMLKLLPRLKA